MRQTNKQTDEEMMNNLLHLLHEGDYERLEEGIRYATRVLTGRKIALDTAEEWADNFANRDIKKYRTLLTTAQFFVGETGTLPKRSHKGDAGLDLFASDFAVIYPGDSKLVGTDVRAYIEYGFMGGIYSRSGLAYKSRVRVANGVGVIDHGYKGELKVHLENFGTDPYYVRPGDRIAQLVIEPVALPRAVSVDEETFEGLHKGTKRKGGHGSTGR